MGSIELGDSGANNNYDIIYDNQNNIELIKKYYILDNGILNIFSNIRNEYDSNNKILLFENIGIIIVIIIKMIMIRCIQLLRTFTIKRIY